MCLEKGEPKECIFDDYDSEEETSSESFSAEPYDDNDPFDYYNTVRKRAESKFASSGDVTPEIPKFRKSRVNNVFLKSSPK